MWSSRIWIICSQMLYWGLLLEDVHVQLEVKRNVRHQDGRRHTAGVAEDTRTEGTKDSPPAVPRSPAHRQGGIPSPASHTCHGKVITTSP